MPSAGEGTYANYECDGIPESTFDEYDLRVIVSDAASGGIIDESYWTYDIGADGSELNECAVSGEQSKDGDFTLHKVLP